MSEKKIPVLRGSRITLRGVRESDIDDRLRIGRHHEFIHMCGGETLPEPEYPDRTVWEDWYNAVKEDPYAWIIELDGRCIGTAGFHQIAEEDRCATYRIGIFDPACMSNGYGTEATKLLVRYGFEEMHLHRIELKVLDYNRRGIRCYEKCGFSVDGILRENALIEGKFYSDIVMSLLEPEFRALCAEGMY